MAKKAQMAMWILTKFGMLFFIVGLFSIIFVFQDNAKKQSCTTQAQGIADSISNKINQIVDSPIEDEQRSIVFDKSIPLGKEQGTGYFVSINDTQYKNTPKSGALIIEVTSKSYKYCSGASRVDYSKTTVSLFPSSNERSFQSATSKYNINSIVFSPSDNDPAKISYYLVAIKCSSKSYPPTKYLYIQDCTQNDPNLCYSFNTAEIDDKCGFKE
ncbi:hypothetical protein HY989_01240 [Candidatus Micrarchaeota archaeon]|nr:hypothetical protein [Candidatus Micrarchaeota archaeon]